jgi:hypothetical protein
MPWAYSSPRPGHETAQHPPAFARKVMAPARRENLSGGISGPGRFRPSPFLCDEGVRVGCRFPWGLAAPWTGDGPVVCASAAETSRPAIPLAVSFSRYPVPEPTPQPPKAGVPDAKESPGTPSARGWHPREAGLPDLRDIHLSLRPESKRATPSPRPVRPWRARLPKAMSMQRESYVNTPIGTTALLRETPGKPCSPGKS